MLVTRKEALVLTLGVLLIGGCVAEGCSLVTSYDGFAPTPGAAASGCGKELPTRSAGSAGGGTKTLVGAVSDIRFTDQSDAAPLGYDIDKLCTCPGKTACRSRLGAGMPCDVPAGSGVDNAIGGVLQLLYPPSTVNSLPTALKAGKGGLVIQIQNYNGTRDDADVSVSFFNVVGVNGKTDGTGEAAFNGSDDMIVDSESLTLGTSGPKFFDNSAFVANGVLVASLADYPLRLQVPNPLADAESVVYVPMKVANFIGKIQTVGSSGLKMTDAQFVGRLGDSAVFEQLGRLGLCQDSGSFAGVKETACKAMDVPAAPALDGKDVPCDALSFAIGMVVSPAKLGGNAAIDAGPPRCGEEPPATCN